MGQSQGSFQHQDSVPQNASSSAAESSSAGAEGSRQARNLRTMFQEAQSQQEQRRQSRSKSLDPRSTYEMRKLEHCKSARYGQKAGLKNCGKKEPKELWNPDKAAALLIGQQLQNPHSPPPVLVDQLAVQLQMQSRQSFRKQSSQYNDLLDDRKLSDTSLTGLSSHQISILQKIWERSSEAEISDCSRNIMSHLLRSNAQMYQFFDLLGLSDREILTSSTFVRMSANFAIVRKTLFYFVLANMQDEVQKVCMALQFLGAQHARLHWPIEPHHWALFIRCFEDNPPKEVFQNAEGHELWKTMINFLVIQMRHGYDRGVGAASTTAKILSSPRLSAYRHPLGVKKNGEGGRKKYAGMRANTILPDSDADY